MKQEVESTVIKTVNHIPAMSALKVEFHSGATYQYHPVTVDDYKGLMESKSKGEYLNQHFRGKGKRVWR